MNVYDFDNTIYDGDSSIDFTIFAMTRNVKTLRVIPRQIQAVINYKHKRISKEAMKEALFSYLNYINEPERLVENFWNKNKGKIKQFYLKQQANNDLIISASPYFLLQPICKMVGINNLLATDVDINTGKFNGKNCYGEEKVARFREAFPSQTINEFYSDSYSDEPLAKISDKSYIVKGRNIKEW